MAFTRKDLVVFTGLLMMANKAAQEGHANMMEFFENPDEIALVGNHMLADKNEYALQALDIDDFIGDLKSVFREYIDKLKEGEVESGESEHTGG